MEENKQGKNVPRQGREDSFPYALFKSTKIIEEFSKNGI